MSHNASGGKIISLLRHFICIYMHKFRASKDATKLCIVQFNDGVCKTIELVERKDSSIITVYKELTE